MLLKLEAYKLLEIVDRPSGKWYVVKAYRFSVMTWIQEQNFDYWLNIYGRIDDAGYFIDGKTYVLHEKLYTTFILRWS